jgi:hypothetical protein
MRFISMPLKALCTNWSMSWRSAVHGGGMVMGLRCFVASHCRSLSLLRKW